MTTAVLLISQCDNAKWKQLPKVVLNSSCDVSLSADCVILFVVSTGGLFLWRSVCCFSSMTKFASILFVIIQVAGWKD